MTTKTVEVHDAQRQLADLLDEVAAGTEIILTEGNEPRALIIPLNSERPRRIPGLNRGSMEAMPDFDDPLPDEFWTGEL